MTTEKIPPPSLAALTIFELRWLQVVAGVASVIGMVALLGLITQGWAADAQPFRGAPVPRGFAPPGAAPNPFGNGVAPGQPPGSPGGGFFEEDDEEDLDFNDPNFGNNNSGWPPGAAPAGGGGRGARKAPPQVAANDAPSDSGVSMGGGPAGGVISNRKVQAITINDETGTGSKEVVTDFNFPDADIMDIAKTLGKLTGKNFILDKDVKGRITIISNSAITVGDAWKAFLTALDINGFALIPSGKYIRIARQRDARDKQLSTYTGSFAPDSDALITRVFPLKYIDSEEVARTFRSFMPANSRIIPHDQTNTVIVTDTGANINKLAKMLEILDIEGYDVGISVISVKFASAVELSKLIDQLIPGTGGGIPGQPPGAPRFGGGAGRFNARRTKEGGVINTIIADERTNTLIVNANQKGVEQVQQLIRKLDQKIPAAIGGGRIHVVYLQFADAEQISTTLNNLSAAQSGGAGGFRPVIPGAGGGTGVNPVQATLFEGQIKISPDKATNSLVITASPADFVTVQRVINRLDIVRDEVYVEVVVMEISLNRDSVLSTNVASPASGIGFLPNGKDLLDLTQNPFALSGAILGFKSGGTQTIQINGGNVTVSGVMGLINAIQTNTKSNILATPQIIALDNTEATFDSTEKIPVPQSNAVQGTVASSFGKENVTLSIKIKPQINKLTNFVKLDTEVKLGSILTRALPKAVQDSAYATLERNAKTTVIIGDSDTVVLGGLIRDSMDDVVNKIPLLGDIPILGWLFRSKTTKSGKSNLLIFMTPHIVRQYEKVRAILDRKLKERDDFLESNSGGEDPMRYRRDEIIRSLPDVNEIKKPRTDRAVQLDDEVPGPAGDSRYPSVSGGGGNPVPLTVPPPGTPGASAAPNPGAPLPFPATPPPGGG